MKKCFLFCFLFIFNWLLIFAEPKYPVDISYLVADFKYSQEHGIKICEVQHGSLSAVTGDVYLWGGDGTISPKVADFYDRFAAKKWAVGLIYPPLKRSLAEKGWDVLPSMNKLLIDPTFLERATLQPVEPFSISSYTGMVFADFDVVRNFSYYRDTYPGILFLNLATFPYWRDKYTMNALFDQDDDLKQYKADWKLYPKKYDPFLAQRIQAQMPSELYVIKPRNESLANGLIVVASTDLDKVLKMILEPLAILEKHPDKTYSYWFKNLDNTFLIEKYYKSDYLSYPRPMNQKSNKISSEYHYDATMRLAFILQSNGEKLTYHSLGGFWKLPSKALEEEGTLNETRVSICKPPFYDAVDPELLKTVNAQMEKAMLPLYEIMLKEISK